MNNSPAWEQDPFWKEVVDALTGGDRLRPDSYLQNLNSEELEQLRACLSSAVPFAVMRTLAPKWHGGAQDGNPPGTTLLKRLWAAAKQADALKNLERDNLLLEAARKKAESLGLGKDEAMLDGILTVVAQEVLNKSLTGEDPKNRTAAAKLLLKRQDQKMERDKFAAAMKSKIEAGLDALFDEVKNNPEALELFGKFKSVVTKATAA